MPPDYNDPHYWNEREAEARQIADNLTDEKARKQMIEVAEAYARLAKLAQQRLVARQRPSGALL